MLFSKLNHSLSSLPSFKKVVVGVSGGADSVALADLMVKQGYQVTIAHLNHGLRATESDMDEQFVKDLAEKWGALCVVDRAKISKKGNVENNARIMRYAFLEKVRREQKAKFIAVAHHQDDQIETILMHLQRGAGLRGLQGMSAQSGALIRPLLSFRKSELINYLKGQNIDHRVDTTNFDTTLKRNFMRHVVIPEMKKKNKNFEKELLKMSEQARAKLEKIEKLAEKWIRTNVLNDQFDRLVFLSLSDDIQSEVLFQLAGRIDLYRVNIDEIKKLIQQGKTGKQKKIGELIFGIEYDKVCLEDEKTHITADNMQQSCKLNNGETRWGKWKIEYHGPGVLKVRSWKPGDRFQPAGMKGSKKLQDFFVDAKIPKKDRIGVPIIVDLNDQILSVADFRVAKGAEPLKQYLRIKKVL